LARAYESLASKARRARTLTVATLRVELCAQMDIRKALSLRNNPGTSCPELRAGRHVPEAVPHGNPALRNIRSISRWAKL